MLRIDYTGCLSDRVREHGIDADRLASEGPLAARARELTDRLETTRGSGWERWRLLAQPGPGGMRDEHVASVRSFAGSRAGRFENLVVLGIGGSGLGNIALQSALNPSTHNLLPEGERRGPRVFVLDNVDPTNVGAVLDACPPERTLFNVISKSGETAETAAQFMVVREAINRALGERAREHVVAITDPAAGTMRSICDAEGYDTLPVPEGVGGRFSVLSPVGLFSAAMAGIDIEGLLDGAHEMETRCREPELSRNPAATLATLLVQLGQGGYRENGQPKPNHVMMPYSNAMYSMADWYRQLWAESLGKQRDREGNLVFAGFTPIKALGATDQHSQVQLYREGPNDKVFVLVEVESFDREVTIPSGLGVGALDYLEGQPMSKLLNSEKRATEFALGESLRPTMTIRFPRLDARHAGQFVMLWQVATAYAGLMLGIDAYDQPAVETGKKATFGLMGRAGYEDWQHRVGSALGESSHVV
jgi:glucose-6-phosphate isomerase